MQRTARRWTVAALATVIAMGAGGTAAHAAGEQSVVAEVTSGPFKLKVTANRAAGTRSNQSTGTFDAETKVGPLALMDLHGPVTCLDVRGNSVGLFYPIERSTPSLLSMVGAGIYIYLKTDGKGRATNVQFLPVPFASVPGCRPLPAFLPATGTATIQGS
ncbi:hypothetical protein DSM112329_00401 [Paraconexibacter sp. AEG42_29]|uniref:Secreted protein n=1 Tax=Paraconexibacter sp. AEG42_29 TaxID=2997339 RepID=A0AAU7APQ6_9ACTN